MTSQKTILIVDDEDALRFVLRSTLESHGFNVLDADNGLEALSIARTSPPDLVLCDIEMPGMDGFELLTKFREHAATSGVPFVFLTGRSDRPMMRKGMNLGADDFMTKPVTAEEVYEAVQSRIRKEEAQRGRIDEKLGELREHITRSVPHELRTPLTGIIGFAQILQEQGQDMPPEEFREIVDQIMRSAESLRATLEKFWYYSQVVLLARNDKDVAELRLGTMKNPGAILDPEFRRKAALAGRESDLRMRMAEGCIAVSQVHGMRILGEIFENALKFSKPGTVVEVIGTVLANRGFYQFSVADRGRGMSRDQAEGIGAFTQFEREKYEQQGLGLGLSTVLELVTLYRGEMSIDSTPFQGTTVAVRLPLCA